MRFFLFSSLIVALASLCSCGPRPASREKALEIAWRYASLEWTPLPKHVHHGPDSDGITVHTPDANLSRHGYQNGWWKPGQPARGMPYQWGGFDTPESFLDALKAGKFAGDISTSEKVAKGDDVVSRHAAGIDCSGFVSRCWGLPRPYSTKQLPSICTPLSSWDELKPGDILLNHRHVVLFTGWKVPGESILIYEAGPYPMWKVNSSALYKQKLIANGYAPWRYKGIRD